MAYFWQSKPPHNHVWHCPISCHAPGRAINNVRSLYFFGSCIPFAHLNAISTCSPCRESSVLGANGRGKKHIENRSVSGWANRTLGESWSVALVWGGVGRTFMTDTATNRRDTHTSGSLGLCTQKRTNDIQYQQGTATIRMMTTKVSDSGSLDALVT